jgi:hypothetical protein
MSKVIELTKENFDREVLQSNIPVLAVVLVPVAGLLLALIV